MTIENGPEKMNRRQFLQGAVAAGALAALGSETAEAETKSDRPFGMDTIPYPGIDLAEKWRAALLKMKESEQEYEAGESGGARKMAEIIRAAETYEGVARIGHLNLAVNGAITEQSYHEEITQPILEWPTPLEVFDGQKRDCKAYAVAKYFALQKMNIPKEDLCAVVVQVPPDPTLPASEQKNLEHVVVGVRNSNEWKLLDSWSNTLVNDKEFFSLQKRGWKPLFLLDQTGLSAFVNRSVAGR